MENLNLPSQTISQRHRVVTNQLSNLRFSSSVLTWQSFIVLPFQSQSIQNSFLIENSCLQIILNLLYCIIFWFLRHFLLVSGYALHHCQRIWKRNKSLSCDNSIFLFRNKKLDLIRYCSRSLMLTTPWYFYNILCDGLSQISVLPINLSTIFWTLQSIKIGMKSDQFWVITQRQV